MVDTSTHTNTHVSSHRSTQRSLRLQHSTRRPLSQQPSHRDVTHELLQNSTHTRDTHHQTDNGRNGAVGSLLRTNVEQAMVDMVVQAGGATVSRTHPLKTSSPQSAEARTQDVTSNTYIYTSPSGISSSESTLVNTPTRSTSTNDASTGEW